MSSLLALDLWSPHQGLSLGMVIVTAFVLGLVHGVTPDEHTWPITFSYALGSFSVRKGMRSALAFSLSFTVQRALLSELAYLGLVQVVNSATWNAGIYAVVGVVMALAAFYVLRLRCALHLHLWPPSVGECHRPSHADTAEWAGRTPSPAMAVVHGFVAGWGLGAFALIMATVLAPAMPSAGLGWVPGAAFGLGTTAVLAGAGAVIGSLVRHQRLPEHLARRVAQEGAGWSLLVGGAMFMVVGATGLVVPSIMTAGIPTGIHVHNLDRLGVGTLLVFLVVVVAVVVIVRTVQRLRSLPPQEAPRRLVLLARPGAGKSTQAQRLASRLAVAHLSSGALLREEVASSSRVGREVAPALEQGHLADDELVVAAITTGIEHAASGGGYVLDGFPRDLAQAEVLDKLDIRGFGPQMVLSLEVSADECRRRLLQRRGVEGRPDDAVETIDRRLAAYETEMGPVLLHYRSMGILVTVDGEGSPDEVTDRIVARLGLGPPGS